MTGDMTRFLEQIERGLIAQRRLLTLGLLRPGLEPHHVRTLLAARGFPPDAELEALYGWHDGMGSHPGAVLGHIWLFPCAYLLSLEEATVTYATSADDPRWDPRWLPLFADGGGDYYVLDFNESVRRPIRHFRNEEEEHPIEFASISDMVATLAEASSQGVFYVDGEGYADMDYDEFAGLAARLNPNVAYWNESVNE